MSTDVITEDLAEPLEEVVPGELIKAGLMNALVRLVKRLTERVADIEGKLPGQLEPADLPVIVNVYPGDSSDAKMQIVAGQSVTIVGKNLVPNSVVRIDNVEQAHDSHTDGTITIGKVERAENPSPHGLALVAVTNDTGSGSRIVTLK